MNSCHWQRFCLLQRLFSLFLMEKQLLWMRLIHSNQLETLDQAMIDLCQFQVKSIADRNYFYARKNSDVWKFLANDTHSCVWSVMHILNDSTNKSTNRFPTRSSYYLSAVHFRRSFNCVLIRQSHWLRLLGNCECKIASSAYEIPLTLNINSGRLFYLESVPYHWHCDKLHSISILRRSTLAVHQMCFGQCLSNISGSANQAVHCIQDMITCAHYFPSFQLNCNTKFVYW